MTYYYQYFIVLEKKLDKILEIIENIIKKVL